MPKTNLTIQLDAETIRRARVVAAKRGTSISALVAHELEGLVADDERYELARARALELLATPVKRGGRTWSRGDLYDDRV
jgi:hypothetical protein